MVLKAYVPTSITAKSLLYQVMIDPGKNTNTKVTKDINNTLNFTHNITLCSALSGLEAPKCCPTKVAAALLKPQAGKIKNTTFLMAI